MKTEIKDVVDLASRIRERADVLRRMADRLERGLGTVATLWKVSVAAVGAAYNVAEERLVSADRRQHVAWARYALIYLLRELEPNASYPVLAALLNRDHSTVIHGHNEVLRRIARQPIYAAEIAKLRAYVEGQARSVNGEARGAVA